MIKLSLMFAAFCFPADNSSNSFGKKLIEIIVRNYLQQRVRLFRLHQSRFWPRYLMSLMDISLNLPFKLLPNYTLFGKRADVHIAGGFRRVYHYGRECIRCAFFLAFILIVSRCENDRHKSFSFPLSYRIEINKFVDAGWQMFNCV